MGQKNSHMLRVTPFFIRSLKFLEAKLEAPYPTFTQPTFTPKNFATGEQFTDSEICLSKKKFFFFSQFCDKTNQRHLSRKLFLIFSTYLLTLTSLSQYKNSFLSPRSADRTGIQRLQIKLITKCLFKIDFNSKSTYYSWYMTQKHSQSNV